MASNPSPKISLLRSDLDGEQHEPKNDAILDSISASKVPFGNFAEPPIPEDRTYLPNVPQQNNTNTNTSGSSTWNYDNFIEKPQGHVAEPRYVTPTTDSENSARTFRVEGQGYLTEYTSLGCTPLLLAICAYFFGFVGGFIVLSLEQKNLFVIFHGWQSFTAGVIAFLIQLLFVWQGTVYTILWILYLTFNFFMIVRVSLDSQSPTRRLFKLPVIGDWCERRAFNKIQYAAGNHNFYRMAP